MNVDILSLKNGWSLRDWRNGWEGEAPYPLGINRFTPAVTAAAMYRGSWESAVLVMVEITTSMLVNAETRSGRELKSALRVFTKGGRKLSGVLDSRRERTVRFTTGESSRGGRKERVTPETPMRGTLTMVTRCGWKVF